MCQTTGKHVDVSTPLFPARKNELFSGRTDERTNGRTKNISDFALPKVMALRAINSKHNWAHLNQNDSKCHIQLTNPSEIPSTGSGPADLVLLDPGDGLGALHNIFGQISFSGTTVCESFRFDFGDSDFINTHEMGLIKRIEFKRCDELMNSCKIRLTGELR